MTKHSSCRFPNCTGHGIFSSLRIHQGGRTKSHSWRLGVALFVAVRYPALKGDDIDWEWLMVYVPCI